MVYIVYCNSEKIEEGKYGIYDPTMEYISLSKEKALAYLEKERYRLFNLEGNEIEEDKPESFACSVNNMWYDYWLEEYPEDTDLRAWYIKTNDIF